MYKVQNIQLLKQKFLIDELLEIKRIQKKNINLSIYLLIF
jgi:hypothetical protein